jgi:hypothetical protein
MKKKNKKHYTFSLDQDVYQKIVDMAWEARLRYSQQVELILKDYLRRIKEAR